MSSPEYRKPEEIATSAFMREEEFTPEMLRNISLLCRTLARGNAARIIGNEGEENSYKYIVEAWDKFHTPFEYRVGSIFGLDSKLWFARKPCSPTANRVEVWFDSGLDIQADADKKEQARNMEVRFAQALQERIGPPPQVEF